MKRIVKLIIILSLFVQVGLAQTAKTEEEYKIVYDSIVSRLTLVEKKADCCVGKSFSELVKLLDKYGATILRVKAMDYDSEKLYPQHVFGIKVTFTTEECTDFAWRHDLLEPFVFIDFKESKPYEKALSLLKKYKSHFAEEMEEFYSDAVIKSIGFYFMDNMYGPMYKKDE